MADVNLMLTLIGKGDLCGVKKLCADYKGPQHVIAYAAKLGNLEIVKCLFENINIDPNTIKHVINSSIHGKYLDIVWYFLKLGHMGTMNGLNAAARYGYIDIIHEHHKHEVRGDTSTLNIAIKNGHKGLVEYLLSNNYIGNWDTLSYAAVNGHTDIMTVLIAHGYKVSDDIFMCSVIHNRVGVLQWLHNNNYRADNSHLLLCKAVKHQKIDIITCLLECGYRMVKRIFNRTDNLDMLKLFHKYGHHSTSAAATHAALQNDIVVLKYLRSIGCRIDVKHIARIKNHGTIDVFAFLSNLI